MSRMQNNLMQLEWMAEALGTLLPDMTFVGGSTTLLLVDEAAQSAVRQTEDVDVIVDVASPLDYHKLGRQLRDRGFREATEGPICRWLLPASGVTLTLDVMPTDEKILGFSNRWYKNALSTANKADLPSGKTIRVVSPAYFIATKFEAFMDRGKGDYFSHDLEDIVFVMENRKRLVIELMDCPSELKSYLSEKASALLNDRFLNVLPGLLTDPGSARNIVNQLNIMASWAQK